MTAIFEAIVSIPPLHGYIHSLANSRLQKWLQNEGERLIFSRFFPVIHRISGMDDANRWNGLQESPGRIHQNTGSELADSSQPLANDNFKDSQARVSLMPDGLTLIHSVGTRIRAGLSPVSRR